MTAAAGARAAAGYGESDQERLQARSLRILLASQVLSGAGLVAGVTVGALLAEDMIGTTGLSGLPAALFTFGSAGAAMAPQRATRASAIALVWDQPCGPVRALGGDDERDPSPGLVSDDRGPDEDPDALGAASPAAVTGASGLAAAPRGQGRGDASGPRSQVPFDPLASEHGSEV